MAPASRSNVLIISASRDVILVRAFQQALAQAGGGKVIAADMSRLAPALYAADGHHLLPPSQAPEFLPALLDICRRDEIGLLISSRDEDLPILAGHRQSFAEAGTTVMAPEPETLEICLDKQLFIAFCRDNGLATPRSYNPEELRGNAPFPLFAKPRIGKASRQTCIINTREELEAVLKAMPDAVIQEYVDAPEYTVDLFADFSGKIISVVPRERLLVFGGESYIGRTFADATLIEAACNLAEKLRLVGHNTIQCFYAGGRASFIEVNPRFGGGANLGFAAGAPTPLYLVKLMKGETLEPVIGRFRNNYVMLRYAEDMFIDGDDPGSGGRP